jgi:hypothetical protein
MLRRSPIKRYARLQSRAPMPKRSGISGQFAKMRRSPMPKRRSRPRDRGEYEDKPFLAWLRLQPCRVPGCPNHSEAHHLRHDEHGASLGALMKDDRRAISLCHGHHLFERHGNAGYFYDWSRGDIQAWEDCELAMQRSTYLLQLAAA